MGWKVAYDVLEDGFMDIETYNVPAYIPDNLTNNGSRFTF